MSDSPEVGTQGFWSIARRHPERAALILDDGSIVTYAELERRVNQISHGLRSAGLDRGATVAAALRNRREFYELALATAQTGMCLVPVNWHLTGSELDYIVRDSDAGLLVADPDVAARVAPDVAAGARYVVDGSPPSGWDLFARFAADLPTTLPEDRRCGSLMLYTSGTTGRPKGVQRVLPDLSPEAGIEAMFLPLVRAYGESPDQDGVHLLCSPAYHAAPLGHSLSFLHAGHTVVIRGKFDAARTVQDIERFAVTSTHMVPTHFHRLLALPQEVRDRADLSSLRALITAGAPCPAWLKEAMIDWVGPVVFEYLGSTEGGVTRVSSAEALERPGTVGRPAPGVVVSILDQNGDELAAGEAGTIWFGSANGTPPAFEYRNDPAKTTSMRHGSLATVGDLGYVDADGYVFLLDRRDDLIISGGVNVYPAEVEACLIADPAVSDVAVVGIADAEWGQRVVAVVEVVPTAQGDDDLVARLQQRCRLEMASFKHPREFVFADRLPRTESGKLQRRTLRQNLDERSISAS